MVVYFLTSTAWATSNSYMASYMAKPTTGSGSSIIRPRHVLLLQIHPLHGIWLLLPLLFFLLLLRL